MKNILFALLLAPVFVFAQNSPQRAKLTMNASYEQCIRLYIQTHPEAVEKTSNNGKVLFVKRNDAYLKDIKDTINGLTIQQIDPSKDIDLIGKYIAKKAKITIIDIEKMTDRPLNSYIWILPMKASFNHKKKKLSEPKYEDKLCEYIFDFTPERNQYFYFKESSCKEME